MVHYLNMVQQSANRVNRWIVAMVVSFATLMEALPHITGSLGMTRYERAWVVSHCERHHRASRSMFDDDGEDI
jgi:hypothetical protein